MSVVTQVAGVLTQVASPAYTDAAPLLGASTEQAAIDVLKTYGVCYRFQPGGVAAQNVFTTFAAAYAACAAAVATGAIPTLICDNTFGACVTGAAGALDFSRINLLGVPAAGAGNTALTFQTGTTVPPSIYGAGFKRIERLQLASTSNAVVWTFGQAVGWIRGVELLDASIVGGSSAPFFTVLTCSSGFQDLFFTCYGQGGFAHNGAQPAGSVATPSYIQLSLYGSGGYDATAFSGTGNFAPTIYSPSASVTNTQANISGTVSIAYAAPGPLQRGVATLVNGTITITTAVLTAASRIFVDQKVSSGASLSKGYAALTRTPSAGVAGSFTITALTAGADGTTNAADQSTVDWSVQG